MDKLPYAKYQFSIWIVAILASIFVKFITDSPFVLVPLCVGMYWISVKGFSRIKGY